MPTTRSEWWAQQLLALVFFSHQKSGNFKALIPQLPESARDLPSPGSKGHTDDLETWRLSVTVEVYTKITFTILWGMRTVRT